MLQLRLSRAERELLNALAEVVGGGSAGAAARAAAVFFASAVCGAGAAGLPAEVRDRLRRALVDVEAEGGLGRAILQAAGWQAAGSGPS